MFWQLPCCRFVNVNPEPESVQVRSPARCCVHVTASSMAAVRVLPLPFVHICSWLAMA